ncbi:DUF590-domain-containing protein [Coniophora puteana RWD-64-598 SS2]|uniref:DUF590-domain-containing protein n=1 Tax=Coniophora puteana (strain RWD-64-598) TaxID=741705 RepID=A0A5M3MSP1_CONPW|nr:DUF590-domain-containing protein [Coniophora puteana RWD-64-598 SS2]EIW81754.1 DUF590-domain-containing protein [Coniophora puteana RWD-64-598 SS2]
MPPQVDVVIVFRSTPKGAALSKNELKENAAKAEKQYSVLVDTLTRAGLKAVGRRGENQGQLLVLVTCPQNLLATLVHRERQSDFLYGLPMANLPAFSDDFDTAPLTPADRLRLVHAFITSTPQDGGLGIIPLCKEWDLVESVMVLHDPLFNEQWIHLWTRNRIATVQLDRIRSQFGDSVALYFHFLEAYTRALAVPAALGFAFYFLGTPYSALYSSLLLLWSIGFVEWWRLQERKLSVRWCTRGSARVERRRADYVPGFPWWKRELRIVASIPVILLFASVLAIILTVIFILEAFVTQLYTGPGSKLVSFMPTVLFMAIVPQILNIYRVHATRYTDWENHSHQSTHTASLTIKEFALAAINAYLGLALSAFVYVPFGESVMTAVHQTLLSDRGSAILQRLNIDLNQTLGFGIGHGNVTAAKPPLQAGEHHHHHADAHHAYWEVDGASARQKLNPSRLQEQMFAFTVTNQAVNTFMEIGLPFVMRAVDSFRNGKGLSGHGGGSRGGLGKGQKKKRVAFEKEGADGEEGKGKRSPSQDARGKEEREFLERVRSEVALPEYQVFTDYSEMATQFGYVALWSTIWPLAPVMAYVNNFFEARSDAFKITVHTRRPVPIRTDTIGPWLDALTFLTWLAALTNSALVYLFRPPSHRQAGPDAFGTALNSDDLSAAGTGPAVDAAPGHHHHAHGQDSGAALAGTRELLVSALLVSLVASHGYILLRSLMRHLLERAIWTGSEEERTAERVEREIKEKYVGSLAGRSAEGEGEGRNVGLEDARKDVDDGAPNVDDDGKGGQGGEWSGFWATDEGLDEIQKLVKED